MRKVAGYASSLLIGFLYLMLLEAPVNRYLGLDSRSAFSVLVNIFVLGLIYIVALAAIAVVRILCVTALHYVRHRKEMRGRPE